MTTQSLSFVLAAFLSAVVFSFSSCSEDEGGVSVSGKASLHISIAGISAGGEESLTRAALEPETVVLTADDGTPVEFTLSVDPASVTRAANPMDTGKKYRVIAYKSTDNSYADEKLFTAGTNDTLILPPLASGYYKLVAISYNTTADPGAVGSDADGDGNVNTITVDPSNDLLHWVGGAAGNGAAGIHDTPITFKHRFTKLTVRATSTLTGNNITGVPASATLTPGYQGRLTLLTDGAPAEYGTASAQTFAFNTTNNDTVAASTTTRYVFTGDDTPVTLTFSGTLTVNNKTLSNPVAKFAQTGGLLSGYSYTLTMRVEAGKGDFYPIVGGSAYEVTIPLGDNRTYTYTKANGTVVTGQTTLTFLRYNLGADPSMTPKEQMAYPYIDIENIRVYGGLWQWGRKDAGHSFRAPKTKTTDNENVNFQNSSYSSYNPATDTKFVWGTSDYTWHDPDVHDSNMWGNGKGLSNQTDFRPSQATITPLLTANSYNPCPSGYRVPTEHEWALTLNEGGSSTSDTNDRILTDYSYYVAYKGTTWYVPLSNENVVWVRVTDGNPSTTFTAYSIYNSMNGWAIYRKTDITSDTDPTSAYDTAFDTDNDLTDGSAPNPLMFLPIAGYRIGSDSAGAASVTYTGSKGQYWSSTVVNTGAYALTINSNMVYLGSANRVDGMSVRCIKE
ncbi:MAG: fibrobacter succinogenes major paralogous domain-containing protein [Dysgonamonadaceae bacterium]|jgi:hypothetical protein|nr:fibrobacter succinogenes major paralogous domain-containing protein [Dysgonamonadaceae bacterium]